MQESHVVVHAFSVLKPYYEVKMQDLRQNEQVHEHVCTYITFSPNDYTRKTLEHECVQKYY